MLVLSVTSTSIQIYDENIIHINHNLLLQQIYVTKQSDGELRNYLQYELAPYPMSFHNRCFQKTQKSTLFKLFDIDNFQLDTDTYVIDSGMLRHRIQWN